MNINLNKEQECELFTNWKKKDPSIVLDGVVSWDDYYNSNIRILFVLKEVNSDESDWDLRDFLGKGGRSFTWNNIVRWIIGIRHLDINLDWNNIKDIDENIRIDNLKTIAAINLKKTTGGKAVANNNGIRKYAFEYRELLKKQIDIYDPELIICCGTADAFFDSVYKDIDVVREMTHNGILYVKINDRIIIAYNHPEARVSPNLLYYPLIDALKEIFKKHPTC